MPGSTGEAGERQRGEGGLLLRRLERALRGKMAAALLPVRRCPAWGRMPLPAASYSSGGPAFTPALQWGETEVREEPGTWVKDCLDIEPNHPPGGKDGGALWNLREQSGAAITSGPESVQLVPSLSPEERLSLCICSSIPNSFGF